MPRRLAGLLAVAVLCVGCAASTQTTQPLALPTPAGAEPTDTSAPAIEPRSELGTPCGCGSGGSLITSNLVMATTGQPVPAMWTTGSGTVTVTDARWADLATIQRIESVNGSGNGNGSYLIVAVTYEATTGEVPISLTSWTAKVAGDDARWTPMSTYPDDARQSPSGLRVPSGQRRDTQFAFDMAYGAVDVTLVDASNDVVSDVNLLATWRIDAAPPVVLQTSETFTT